MAEFQRGNRRALSMRDIRPQGWLARQLQIQMEGMTGKLYEGWDSVGSYSGWLGGTGENWERGPYYLDGLLPLAFYLGDQEHYEIALRFVEWTLESTMEDGNFGPVSSREDYWSRFVMLKVLIQYKEISGDARVLRLFSGYVRYLEKELPVRPLTQWSRARAGDLLYCLGWYYEQKPSEEILRLVDLIREQALDWTDLFADFPFVRGADFYYDWQDVFTRHQGEEFDRVMNYHATHIVNLTMGFKYPAVLSWFYDDMDFAGNARQGMRAAGKYHGVASGALNGDEHIAGNDPSRGAELCSVVEYMFSLQVLLETFGDREAADQLERLAYNALPATITEDFMSHQYLQQANQVLVSKAPRDWFNNNDEANRFGLEPHFGCCTANMHQGWPKFLKSLWYREGEDVLEAMVYAPCRIETQMGGKWVRIVEETEYPFRNRIIFRFEQEEPVRFCLRLRVPGWCESSRVKIYREGAGLAEEEKRKDWKPDGPGISLEKVWKKGDVVEFYPEMKVHATRWAHGSLAVERGPLVYGLDIRERWEKVKQTGMFFDFDVYPETPWNYALDAKQEFQVEERMVGPVPFSKAEAPVVLTGKGRRISRWKLEHHSAGKLPESPAQADCPEEKIRLLPFGCTKLRISQFPWYKS